MTQKKIKPWPEPIQYIMALIIIFIAFWFAVMMLNNVALTIFELKAIFGG